MSTTAGEVYRQVTAAFSAGDAEALKELIADDVVWHTDDLQPVPAEFRGRDAFFAAAGTPHEEIAGWEVIPLKVLDDGRTAFAHQLDRFTLKDGSTREIHFLQHIEINERGQLSEVWEFGQSALPR
jgi:ketosteroid isomerase-like protein